MTYKVPEANWRGYARRKNHQDCASSSLGRAFFVAHSTDLCTGTIIFLPIKSLGQISVLDPWVAQRANHGVSLFVNVATSLGNEA